MGGPGSGRWLRFGKHPTLEEVRRLDVHTLFRQGRLTQGTSLTVEYGQVRERITLEWTACYYGGMRPWFCCPHCQRRVGVLCCLRREVMCRHCCQLPYASQGETRVARMYR